MVKSRRKQSQLFSRDFARRQLRLDLEGVEPKARRERLWLVTAVIFLGNLAVIFRLYSLQVWHFDDWQDWALKQHFQEIHLASERGPISDRNGKLLAVSVPAGSVYVRPKQVKDKEALAKAVAPLLETSPEKIRTKLNDSAPFVWLERQVPRAVAEKVAALKIPGVDFMMEARRIYPFNESAAALIGKVGVDGHGLSGIELTLEQKLEGEHRSARVVRDALGKAIEVSDNQTSDFELPRGESVQLTIDSGLQMITDEELVRGQQEANAKAAMAVMVDADTGEILALSQSPAPNFNSRGPVSKSDLKNLLVEAVFEPGSIMKPIVASGAIELGVVTPNDLINCEHGHLQFGTHLIRDVHPSDTISVRDVVIRSSNIGMTKIGLKLGEQKLYGLLKAYGFGRSSGLKLPGESNGILRPVESWAKVDVATHSFGQGIAVTPLQMVRAISAIANGGKLPELRLVNDGTGFTLHRVISEKTAAQVRDMLYGVVEDEHGTGGKAEIDGVRIGGKTGTAQKARPDGRGYQAGSYVASFVGFADASELGLKRNLSLIVVMDEPHASSIYGGTLAAPVFKRIMQRSLHYLVTQRELGEPKQTTRPDTLV